ncbi:MAG: DUF1259 domain-containing protein, partial [Gemmatimonadetes bacterium]|nr:DUF1259 domain-containing protein [Gemmatimonadota bacterium]
MNRTSMLHREGETTMSSDHLIRGTVAFVLLALLGSAPGRAQDAPDLPCEAIGNVLRASASSSGPVCRVTFPRADLGVALLGADLPPGMGLTSWAAFHRTGPGRALVMGDLALTPEELPLVMSGLRENGLLVTAVHRHMLGEQPAVVFTSANAVTRFLPLLPD